MSLSTSYTELLNRGRKAGLTTRELYSAMATRPLEGGEGQPGQADSNGFVASIDHRGHRVYRPLDTLSRS